MPKIDEIPSLGELLYEKAQKRRVLQEKVDKKVQNRIEKEHLAWAEAELDRIVVQQELSKKLEFYAEEGRNTYRVLEAKNYVFSDREEKLVDLVFDWARVNRIKVIREHDMGVEVLILHW